MKKILLISLLVVPFLLSPALASPVPGGEQLMKPMVYLGSDLPDFNLVSPNHLPAPAASMGIGPGSPILIEMPGVIGLCTSNFVWTSKGRVKHYLGAAGHCFIPEGTTATHGPGADYDPAKSTVYACVSDCNHGGISTLLVAALGGRELVGNWVQLGPVAYARQTRNLVGEGDDPVGNDFGIVEIPRELESHIRPSMPVWGGPTVVEDVKQGGPVCVYGNAVGFGEVFPTKARAGVGDGLDEDKRSWKAFLPSFQGDSGSALVTCDRHDGSSGVHGIGAAGILTHIVIFPDTGRIVGTTVPQAIQMAKTDAGISLNVMVEGGTSLAPQSASSQATTTDPGEETVNELSLGGRYDWGAGPFSRTPTTSLLFEEPCTGPGDHCDYEFLDLTVPKGGADFLVTISTEDDADFDVYVYGPDGHFVEGAATGNNPEELTARVTRSGVYQIGVNPFAADEASYSGSATLIPPQPPPLPPFDGEISSGESYSWTGDPPVDASVFTCAEVALGVVSAFCDNEFININLPKRGQATLTVDINAESEGDDFDLYIYPPSGGQLRFEEPADEHAVLTVTESGVYRLGIVARFAPFGTYKGAASLR